MSLVTGVNHISAANFIKAQQTKLIKADSNSSLIKRQMPVTTINLGDESNEQSIPNSSEQQSEQIKAQQAANRERLHQGTNNTLNDKQKNIYSAFNDKISEDARINECTDNQMNMVNDMIKKLKQKQLTEIIDKDKK